MTGENVTLTLKALAPQGAVVSAEQEAAIDHSLPIKRVEAGLKSLSLWGKIVTQNGRDYLIAEGGNEPLVTLTGAVQADKKYFYSQDGVKWVDLQAIDTATAERSAKVTTILVGDVAKQYVVVEEDPNAPAAPPAGEEGGEEEEGGPKGKEYQLPELAVLRTRIDAINAACGVQPLGAFIVNSGNRVVPNRLFPGLSYPEKLESYVHRTVAPGGGKTLGDDLRGTWSVQYDPFKQQAVVRSLLFLGYTFYFSNVSGQHVSFGALYSGFGLRNNDLIFML